MEHVVILGSGPAGLTAALYAARANLAPIVVSGYLIGGQLMVTTDVENFPGFPEGITGPELMERMRAQALRFGARFLDVDATAIDVADPHCLVVHTPDERLQTRSLIIATGASARWLGVEGEEALRGRGVSACATCDGAFFPQKRLVVVGGGDTAMEEALFLTRYAREVLLVHRRDHFRASRIMIDRVMAHPKIRVLTPFAVQRIEGVTAVTGVLLENTETRELERYEVDGVFVAIGHDPNTAFLRAQIACDEHGYILSDDGMHTSAQGVFVAGDVFDQRYRQAVTAAGAGCRAALEVEKYLS